MNAQKQQLCPVCKTGWDMLMLDKKELLCSYQHLNNGCNCKKFVRIEKRKTGLN